MCAFAVFSYVNIADAKISITDMRVTGVLDQGTTSGVIDAGETNSNYEILICGVQADGQNIFNAPTPGIWEELNNGQCAEPHCQLGIWARVIDSTLIEDETCSWAEESSVFTAARISYAGVNTDEPIIDVVCSEFIDGL